VTNQHDPQAVRGFGKILITTLGSGKRNRHELSNAERRPILSETKKNRM
jgi:hypothetical protein